MLERTLSPPLPPTDSVMTKLEFCNGDLLIFAVLCLQPQCHPYRVCINCAVFLHKWMVLLGQAPPFRKAHLQKMSSKSVRDTADISCKYQFTSYQLTVKNPNRRQKRRVTRTCHLLSVCLVWQWYVQWFCVRVLTYTHTYAHLYKRTSQ